MDRLTEGLDLASKACGHPLYERTLTEIRIAIQKGSPVSEAVRFYSYQMGQEGDRFATTLEIGERTGEIDKVIHALSLTYEMELYFAANNLQRIIEPIVIVILAGVIGFLDRKST